jgi:outer membrane protein OmpA-like peptidoglycan-associated protein
VALGLWAFLGLREIYRANEYLGILKKEPGIAITNTEWTAGRLALYGLRDPLSRDPLKLTAGTGIDPSKVDLHLEAYQSLDLAFRAQRKLNAEKDEIENTLLRFDTGSAVLRPASEDRLEDLVRHLKALFAVAREAKQNAQIEVVGHTDSTGTDDINDVLAVNRAATVVAEMRDLGISDSQFVQRGVGDKQPVRIGTGERDQAYNRSVSFRVIIGQ